MLLASVMASFPTFWMVVSKVKKILILNFPPFLSLFWFSQFSVKARIFKKNKICSIVQKLAEIINLIFHAKNYRIAKVINFWRENSNSNWDGFFAFFFYFFSSFQLSRCSLVVAQLHKIICSGDSQWCQNPKRTGVPDFSPRWFGTSCTWTMCAITWRCHSGGFAKTFSRPKIPGKKRGKKWVLIWIFALKIGAEIQILEFFMRNSKIVILGGKKI